MASSTTNYSEIQKDEIEALHSIYLEDFVEDEAKIGAWNRSLDPSFRISLKSNVDEDSTISLHVSLPPTYPKSLPRLKINFGNNVAQKARLAAENVVLQTPKSLLGSEMIYDITTALQEIIDKSAQKGTEEVPTLDEERNTKLDVARRHAEQAEAERQLHASELANQEAADQENQLLNELAQQQKARAERRSAGSRNDSDEIPAVSEVAGGLAFERPSAKVKDPTGKFVSLRAVFQKTLYRKTSTSKLFLVQPSPRLDEESSNAFLCLKQCDCLGNDPLSKRRIQELELQLDTHMHMAPHPNVVTLLNFRIQRTEAVAAEATKWLISILTEFTSQGSLQHHLSVAEHLSPKRTKAWSMQLLEGLHHYHQQGLVHGAVHATNILLWDSEALTTVVKWSDGSYARSLHELTAHRQTRLPMGWKAPEVLLHEPVQGLSAATDVWYFGVCLVQMAFGSSTLRQYETPLVALNDLAITQSMKSVLQGTFNANTKKRPSCWDLLHFEFFRNDEPFLVAEEAGSYSLTRPRTRRDSEAPAEASEYARKFVEEGRLGRGGFGEVFRARNRVDGQLYAVKKIKARSRAALDPVLSETTVLSRLNHPNVVRYFSSWTEEDAGENDRELSEPNTSLETGTTSLSSLDMHPVLPPSSRGLDFISSSHVVFGNADSSEEDSESEDSRESINRPDPDHRQHIRQKSSASQEDDQTEDSAMNKAQPQAGWTYLYIQMEYCKQETLRDLINSGVQSNSNECWRLFRQMVQGLAHIHSAAIVHRDLKPENVFVDSNGDLRIGDFGLARPGEQRIAGFSKDSNKAVSSFTKDIGTAWYVAPEVRSSSATKYDEKADLFSLGIIFFEMNVRFATGMERAEALEPLAKEHHKLPQSLLSSEKMLQARILTSLLEHQPSQRPSCAELLDEVPVQGEDQTTQLVRREVRDPKSQLRSELIAGLFSQTPKEETVLDGAQLTLDIGQKVKLLEGLSAMSRHSPDLELQTKVKTQLMSIFQRHGAVERTDSPALIPHHPCYAASDVVRLLDSTGKLSQLPYDLILPNAVLIARSSRKEAKTFTFGDVYRPDIRKVEPNIYSEADFDIASSSTANLVLDEAETMKVIDEIIDGFPNLANSSMCYHINHSQILAKILAFCDVPEAKRFLAKETLSKLNTNDWSWQRVRHELRSPPLSIAATSLDELERFDFRDTIENASSKLRSMLHDTADLEAPFAHMRILIAFLSRMGVRRKIYLSPLSSYNEKFYRNNLLFQCIFDRKRRAVFAAGGRYDRLIREHQTVASRDSHIHGVGFQMTWSGLCAGMASYLNAQQKSKAKRKPQIDRSLWVTRRCDVLIDCYDPRLLETVAVRVLSELWAHHISAELASIEDSTITNASFTKSSPLKEDPNWIVLIKFPDVVKVRNLISQEDTEVRTTDLISHIQSEIRERNRTEARQPTPKLSRNDSRQEMPSHDPEPDVKVLVSETKGKKTNRKTIVGEAIAQAQDWRKSSIENPIIAIEIKDDIFQGLHSTRLDDPDSWKKLIQASPAGDRQYLGQVQTMLKEQQNTNATFVYNFRTKAIMYYPLRND